MEYLGVDMLHYSVLKKELIKGLNLKEDGVYVDATVGYAGDAVDILKHLKRGFLYAFDQDEEAVNYASKKLAEIGSNFKIFSTNFANLETCLKEEKVDKIDGIIFDLGFSSPQIDDANRGFSFMQDGPLDMRMSKNGLSAKDVVNNYTKDELMKIFYTYGEEKLSGRIAQGIVNKRKEREITRTLELVEIIKESVGAKYFYQNHPERKIFQALRIEVNNELKVLEDVLPVAIKMLKEEGRICVITFHSLEDRIVKRIFKKYSEVEGILKGMNDIPEEYQPILKLVNRKPILPSEEELEENSRSRSAKLRIAERI